MALDIELYRHTIYAPFGRQREKLRRISAVDIEPDDATHTLVFVHGYGGSVAQWLYQLQFFGQTMRVVAPDLRGHGLSDDPVELPCASENHQSSAVRSAAYAQAHARNSLVEVAWPGTPGTTARANPRRAWTAR